MYFNNNFAYGYYPNAYPQYNYTANEFASNNYYAINQPYYGYYTNDCQFNNQQYYQNKDLQISDQASTTISTTISNVNQVATEELYNDGNSSSDLNEESENESSSFSNTQVVSDMNDMDVVDKVLADSSTAISPSEIYANRRIISHQIFESYEQFLIEFKKYCQETFQLFSIERSKKLDEEDDEDDLTVEEESDNDDFFQNECDKKVKNYKHVVFRCIRHKKTIKSKGSKKRNNLQYNSCNCKAYLRLNWQIAGKDKGKYKITKMSCEHNHEVTKESFLFHPRNRKVPESFVTVAKDMLDLGSKAAKVALYLSEKCNKIILAKDLHNLANSASTFKSDSLQLQESIQKQIKRDDGKNFFHYIQNSDQTELYGIFYQSNRMRSIFKTFGRIVFIDGTYGINKNNYPVIVFTVTDHNRNSRIIGFAIIAYERIVVLDVVLDYFKKLNDTSIIQSVMIDKDMKEDACIQKAFPIAQILYCFWHNEKTFKRNMNKNAYLLAKEMMLAENECEFEAKKQAFYANEISNTKSLKYFEENWLNCVDKWAKYKRYGLVLLLQETNNPVEVVNKQIKSFSSIRHKSASMAKCLDAILLYIKSSELRKAVICSNSNT